MDEQIDKIYSEFRQNGGRLTEQRKELIRIILNNPNSSTKEIFYLAKLFNKRISQATVYRTVNSLVDMGYVSYRSISIIR